MFEIVGICSNVIEENDCWDYITYNCNEYAVQVTYVEFPTIAL